MEYLGIHLFDSRNFGYFEFLHPKCSDWIILDPMDQVKAILDVGQMSLEVVPSPKWFHEENELIFKVFEFNAVAGQLA